MSDIDPIQFGKLIQAVTSLEKSMETHAVLLNKNSDKLELVNNGITKLVDRVDSHDEKWDNQEDINNIVIEIDTQRKDLKSRVAGAAMMVGIGGTSGWFGNLLHKVFGS